MSGEKKRLEQFLLQRSAYLFQPEQIDTIRLRAAQREAGKKPVSEKLVKEQQKKRRKARRGKQLRGEVSRAIREQKRFERGERRDRPEDEPRIVGEPRNTGLAYDPDIERRRLDIQEQANRDANLRVLADRRAQAVAQERELAVRRGELAAGRAERRLERERILALPPPAPIVVPPAPAPNIRVEAPQVRVEAPQIEVQAPPPAQVDIGGINPVINVPALPAPADAEPIPEILRLSQQIRADYDAFGQEQRERNEDVLRQIREQTEAQQAQSAAIRQRQEETDEAIRQAVARQDAVNQEIQERLGLGEASMSQARDAVLQEIRDAEGRLRQAAGELDRPVNYDDVILRAVDEGLQEGLEAGTPEALRRRVEVEEVDSPTPSPRPSPSVARPSTPVEQEERLEPEPEEPSGIEGVIAGGGPLQLPNVVVERPGNIGPDESLRLSRPVEELQQELEGLAARSPGGRLQTQIEATRAAEQERQIDEILEADDPERAQQFLAERQRRFQEEQPDLPEVEPVNVAEALRLSRLAIEEAEPVLQLEEADEAEQQRLRLLDSQDFLAGFERPQGSPRSPGRPLRPVATGQAGPILEELLDVAPTPTPTPATSEEDTPPGEGQLAIADIVARGPQTPRQRVQEQLRREAEPEGDEPRPGQVAEGIALFGGAEQPAPDRVIEDAGIVAEPQRQLRELDPDVLLEPVEEAEEVGVVQDNRPQAIRDSAALYGDSIPELAGNVRAGPQRARGQRGGLGYRLRNNTDRTLKKVEPGDVVNIIGVEAGDRGEGRYRLDTQTATGTRVSADQLGPLIEDGSFLFERGHRHELGGHFDENPYGPPPAEPGLLQQGAEAVGGVLVAGAGGAARFAGGVAQGAAEGLVAQLPGAGDVGAALGRGAVAGLAGAGRLAAGAAGAVGEAVFGGEEEEQEP